MDVLINDPITVYHGTTSVIDVIDVDKGKPYKDFGRGFYVTESRNHASSLALRNKRIEAERFGNYCEAYLYTYEMSLSELSGFEIKEFQNADFEWLQFVFSNNDAADTLVQKGQVEVL